MMRRGQFKPKADEKSLDVILDEVREDRGL
jgi:hypothetical protein